ncbi:extracellular solute-binding protein [Verrucomicrobiaceae bacterium 5K15]|uniref:Extracellular solute-binding protein n=1 Tax=Oceaniferula flava TaxID=2800421 RepID=A0AAE2VEA7_9BACT|nr:substrate-binding domain-containing protein [Oceaniferula flavus]MBK1855584.1 extracellular solute-binding protein [Oceaniferula flavus]MBM1136890.1 extracellular solute-binding protein [Oceaniferula flavus]
MPFNPTRRHFLRSAIGAAGGCMSGLPLMGLGQDAAQKLAGVSVEDLPRLKGKLTLYLGRGEGGLYERVIDAVKKRNPDLRLSIRRGPTAALANTIVAEAKMGLVRADVFWAVDSGAIGLVAGTGKARKLPDTITSQVDERFRYDNWVPISGRIRTIPFHTGKLKAADVPKTLSEIADSDLTIGWAPAYGAFQSFVSAMRILRGDEATKKWLIATKKRAKSYAGELGAVMGVARGEVDIAFANHYYTLRLKAGDPDAKVDLAFTNNDAGCLLNASGAMTLRGGELAQNFVRYLLSREAQSFLASEAYEIPMLPSVTMPKGLPDLADIHPPKVDLAQLADLAPTLRLMRSTGVL